MFLHSFFKKSSKIVSIESHSEDTYFFLKIKFGVQVLTSFLKIPKRTFVPPRSQARKFICENYSVLPFFSIKLFINL